MERQEPVMDAGVKPLKKRVRLTWREVRALAAESDGPKEPTLGFSAEDLPIPEDVREEMEALKAQKASETPPAFVPPAAIPKAPEPDWAAIEALLKPRIEAAVQSAVRDLHELALANALTRAKGDVERSLPAIVSRAVDGALAAVREKANPKA